MQRFRKTHGMSFGDKKAYKNNFALDKSQEDQDENTEKSQNTGLNDSNVKKKREKHKSRFALDNSQEEEIKTKKDSGKKDPGSKSKKSKNPWDTDIQEEEEMIE